MQSTGSNQPRGFLTHESNSLVNPTLYGAVSGSKIGSYQGTMKDLKKNAKYRSFSTQLSPEMLTRKELMAEKFRCLPVSAKYREIDAALRNPSMPFYTDQETLKKYSLITGGLLGGGNKDEKMEPPGYVTFEVKNGSGIKDRSSITLERNLTGRLLATLQLPNKGFIEVDDIILNGAIINDMPESDREQVIPILLNRNSSALECHYDSEKKILIISSSSRPVPSLMIEEGVERSKVEAAIAKQYSTIETLDEEYVNCGMAPTSKLDAKSKEFIEKYKIMLNQVQWDEERVDIMIRKATLDGLLISLISRMPWNWEELGEKGRSVIAQFELIEREIKVLNLSLDAKETLDFHMYRGFVFSKLPSWKYPEQREIAISDAMITICTVEQLTKNEQFQPNRIFYKKMAYAFNVFAKGFDNPTVSLRFIDLGLLLVNKCQQMTINDDRGLNDLNQALIEQQNEFKKSIVQINLDDVIINSGLSILIPQIPHKLEGIETQLENMEKIDSILFRTFQQLDEPSCLKNSMNDYEIYLKEEKNPVQIFRATLRYLFLCNYHNYLISGKNISKCFSVFTAIVSKLEEATERVPDNDLCKAELRLFRGCVFIHFPRSEETKHYYDCAINDFNHLKKMGVVLHNDIKAFQHMMYGEHMLHYDPLNAIQLLKQASTLAFCSTVKLYSQKLLGEFLRGFNPIRSCLQLDKNNLIQY